MAKPKAYLSWSSGKDCAFALQELRKAGDVEIIGLLTTIDGASGGVAMHRTPRDLLDAQIAALGLPAIIIDLPWLCPNDVYEQRMAKASAQMTRAGATHVVFGDLFLEDIRAYREKQMTESGLKPLFPLWQRETSQLARDMIASGLVAHIACVDTERLDAGFAGRRFDEAFLTDLPPGIDPCGENGEFHTFVSQSPLFSETIAVEIGEPSMDGTYARAQLRHKNAASVSP